jgi:hypothetical protein
MYATIVLPARVNGTPEFDHRFVNMVDRELSKFYEMKEGSLSPFLVIEMDFPKNRKLATTVLQCALDIATEHTATVVSVDFIDATQLFDKEPTMRDAFVENPKKTIFGHNVTDKCTEDLEGVQDVVVKSSTFDCNFQIGERLAVCTVMTFSFTPTDDQTEMDMVQLQPVAGVQLQPVAGVQLQPVAGVQLKTTATEMDRVWVKSTGTDVVQMCTVDTQTGTDAVQMCTVDTQTAAKKPAAGCFKWMFRFKRGGGQVADETQLP